MSHMKKTITTTSVALVLAVNLTACYEQSPSKESLEEHQDGSPKNVAASPALSSPSPFKPTGQLQGRPLYTNSKLLFLYL